MEKQNLPPSGATSEKAVAKKIKSKSKKGSGKKDKGKSKTGKNNLMVEVDFDSVPVQSGSGDDQQVNGSPATGTHAKNDASKSNKGSGAKKDKGKSKKGKKGTKGTAPVESTGKQDVKAQEKPSAAKAKKGAPGGGGGGQDSAPAAGGKGKNKKKLRTGGKNGKEARAERDAEVDIYGHSLA